MTAIGTVWGLLLSVLLLGACSGGGGDGDPPAITLQSIEINAASFSLPKGSAISLVALGHFSNGDVIDITTSVTWDSTAPQVAAIDSQGTVTSLTEGVTEISAATVTSGSTPVSSKVDVTVTAAALTAIDVHPHSVSLAAGISAVFEASGLYSDGSRQDLSDQVVWTVNDDQVAALANGAPAAGTVIAQQTGETTVSATLQGVEGSAEVVVTGALLESIAVSPAQLKIAQGTTQSLVAVGRYSDQSQSDISHLVQWRSADTNIVSVDSEGRVLGVDESPLAVAVEAELGGIIGTASVTVTDAVLTDIVIEPPQPSLAVGSELALVATGYFSDDTSQDLTQAVTWSVANPDLAEMAEPALLRALAEGETTITATLGGVSSSTTLRVKANDLAAIHLAPANPSLAIGTQLNLNATGNYLDGSTQVLGQQVAWHSTNETVATVDAEGRVTALAAGTTRIVARLGAVVGSVALTVTEATLESLAIAPSTLSLAKGTAQALTVVGSYSDGTTQELTDQALWKSDNPAVVAVESTAPQAGRVTALTPGSATVSATVDGVEAQVTVTVTAATLTGLSISPASPTLAAGTTLAFTAQGAFSDSTTQDVTDEVTWHSSDFGVATVENGFDRGGLVTGLAAGNVDIEAHLAGITAQQTLTVVTDPQAPRSLSIVATPNVILNDGADSSTLVIAVQAADSDDEVADGTAVELVVIEGEAVLAQSTVTTVDGVAEVAVTSTTKGTVVVQATVDGTEVSNTTPLYVTDNFRDIITRVGVISASAEGGMLKAGSRLGVFIFNLSNRDLVIDAFSLFYAGAPDPNLPVLVVTGAAALNNHQLVGGGQTGFVMETSADVPLNDFLLVYSLSEPLTGAAFNVGSVFLLTP